MNKFSRRTFLSGSYALGLGALLQSDLAYTQTQEPLLFIHLFANGGWDTASFCDPKLNTGQKINTWAETAGIQNAGALSYAPVGNNADLFNRHFDKMLVINGINAQTNVHSAGRLTSLTGRNKNGYPSLGALHAITFGGQLPMPLLVGNSFETGGIIAATQINGGLMSVLNSSQLSNPRNLSGAQLQLIENDINLSLAARPTRGPIEFYRSAVQKKTDHFVQTIELYESLKLGELPDYQVVNDMKLAIAAFAAGASVACDFSISGFDTHSNHDKNMLSPMANIIHAADAAWQFAEQLNVAHRLVIFISSEFGRTPFYNDVAGKDHWPFHSAVIMKKNASWGNRVIGKTDDALVGIPLNPSTLQPDNNGVLLDMNHIHKVLRQYLSTSTALTPKYPLASALSNNFLT